MAGAIKVTISRSWTDALILAHQVVKVPGFYRNGLRLNKKITQDRDNGRWPRSPITSGHNDVMRRVRVNLRTTASRLFMEIQLDWTEVISMGAHQKGLVDYSMSMTTQVSSQRSGAASFGQTNQSGKSNSKSGIA